MKRGNNARLSNEAIRQIVSVDLKDDDEKPPPEFLQMKKELRQKQFEVRKLRKKWWTAHKDLEAFARMTTTASRASIMQLNQADPVGSDGSQHQPCGLPLAEVPQLVHRNLRNDARRETRCHEHLGFSAYPVVKQLGPKSVFCGGG
jgi:hypothetical protein